MSLNARQAIVNHPHTKFQRQSQKSDILDPTKTQSNLIGLLTDLLAKGHMIEFTAVNSDHHPDAYLGRHSHTNGFAVDCWPLKSPSAGDYLDVGTPRFLQFLKDASTDTYEYQIGLGGSANTPEDIKASGPTEFQDNGMDHIHLGAKG